MKDVMRHLCLLVSAATVGISAARADDCADPVTQTAMNVCAGMSFRKSDAELNAVYGQIQQRLKGDPDTAKLLVSAQRSWVAFRDSECAFSSSSTRGGSVDPMIYSECVNRLTQKRLGDLKVYLHCEEGDMGCPVPGR